MDALLQERLAVEIGLRTALADDTGSNWSSSRSSTWWTQPRLRRRGPAALGTTRRGVIMPNVIIPIAEETV